MKSEADGLFMNSEVVGVVFVSGFTIICRWFH